MELSEAEASQLIGSKTVREDLELLLNENLPTELVAEFCESGGWPKGEFVEIASIEVGEEQLEAQCSLTFEEHVMSGCPDMPRIEHRQGDFTCIVYSDGSVEFNYQKW